MPRLGRVVLPGYPHHIVQRGHNRQAVFAEDADYERYLSDLWELKESCGVRVYAYCLMTNHVHLLVAPETDAGLGWLMKGLAGRTTRYRNRLENRSGTLWESRYKSSIVQTDTYLLACCRYIELNPVRARVTKAPQDYPWSSCRRHLGLERASPLDLDPAWRALAETDRTRRRRYGAYLQDAVPPNEWALIRDAAQRGQLTGNRKFVDEVARISGRRIELRAQGRPRREKPA